MSIIQYKYKKKNDTTDKAADKCKRKFGQS